MGLLPTDIRTRKNHLLINLIYLFNLNLCSDKFITHIHTHQISREYIFRLRKLRNIKNHPNIGVENSYFRYKCEKVILSSWRRWRSSEARVKMPHEDKMTFSLVYWTQFFYTTWTKLDLAYAFLFERAQCPLYKFLGIFFLFVRSCREERSPILPQPWSHKEIAHAEK